MLMGDDAIAAFNVEVKQRLVEVLRMVADGKIEELKSAPNFNSRFGLCQLMKWSVIESVEALMVELKNACPYDYDNLLTRRSQINYMRDVESSVSFVRRRTLAWLHAFKTSPVNIEGFAYFSGCRNYPVQGDESKDPCLSDGENRPTKSEYIEGPHVAYLNAERKGAQYEGEYGRRRMALAAPLG